LVWHPGSALACALAASAGQGALLAALAPWTTLATLLAALSRWHSLRRNAALRPVSTLQSATGIQRASWCKSPWACQPVPSTPASFSTVPAQLALRNVRWAFRAGPVCAAVWRCNCAPYQRRHLALGSGCYVQAPSR
jgi:hypothetical protein